MRGERTAINTKRPHMSLKNSALTVTGGEVTSASRVDGRSDLWQVIVTPDNGNAVSVSLPVTTDCAATGAVCTEDGKKLSSGDRLFIPSTSTTGNNPATGAPTISGTAQAGETLTASTSDISDADGLDNVEYAYQWLADDMDIDGATGSGYTLTDDEVGKTIKVKVSFTDDADNEESLTSAATAQVSARPNSPATGLPTISGTVQSGETLTASTDDIGDADGLDNVSYNHQWLADDADISGATDSTYTLTGDEVGKTIKVKVTFTDDKNNQETLTSTATGTVAAAPVPLTVSLENKSTSHDGTNDFSFDIRFSEEFDLSYKTIKFHAFNVSGGSVQKAQRLQKEPESNIGWKITVRPDGNGDVTVVLPITTDCEAQGAVCTEDGRKLSNRNEFTVSGPA